MDKSIHEGTDERTNTTNERNRLPSFARAFLVSRFSSLVLLLFLLFFFFYFFFIFIFFSSFSSFPHLSSFLLQAQQRFGG